MKRLIHTRILISHLLLDQRYQHDERFISNHALQLLNSSEHLLITPHLRLVARLRPYGVPQSKMPRNKDRLRLNASNYLFNRADSR